MTVSLRTTVRGNLPHTDVVQPKTALVTGAGGEPGRASRSDELGDAVVTGQLDVRDAVVRAATSGRSRPHGAHLAVGRQAEAMLAASGLTPSRLPRLANRRIAG